MIISFQSKTNLMADLPVAEARDAIIRMIRKHSAVIIVGETGSGKTSQIPQYIADCVLQERRCVAVTQPRRVAAITVARHVASQRNVTLGNEVGYAVRFDDRSCPSTRIKFMTDGILLREFQTDSQLLRYGAIVLDEAHERTLHGDVLFGLLKNLTRTRRDLKIVVMSATMNARRFSEFWRDAPVGIVHGRSFPVTVYHTLEPQSDYLDSAINTILQIHVHQDVSPGDILCFLTGQDEIEAAKKVLEERQKLLDLPKNKSFCVLPVYGALSYDHQMKVFQPAPSGVRKIILATNIAETSITIEGVRFVVDCGMVKCKFWNPATGMESLTEVVESRAQALQRTGRAGRLSAGICYRLFTEPAFEQLVPETVPEIKRCSLNSVILQMKMMGIDDVINFEFMDRPSTESIVKSQLVLFQLGALSREELKISSLGVSLALFPLEPQAAKVLLAGKALGVAFQVTAVVSMMATENIFSTDRERTDTCKRHLAKLSGDHVTYLHLFEIFYAFPQKVRQSWCDNNGLNFRQMLRVLDTFVQLSDLLRDVAIDSTWFPHVVPRLEERASATSHADSDGETVRRAFCFGFFSNCAFFDPKLNAYRTVVGQQEVYVHPSSVLFVLRRKPSLVLFNSVVLTSKRYMKDVCIVHESWICEAAPLLFTARPKGSSLQEHK